MAVIEHEACEKIISTYYREIYSYCFVKLNYRHHSAEDCTQEVFVIFFQKHDKLETADNIRIWLYRTADNVIKACLRKNPTTDVSIENNPEVIAEMAAESSFPEDADDSPLDILSSEERQLLEAYYDTDYGQRSAAAKKLGISLAAMYQKVHKIKKKLRDSR